MQNTIISNVEENELHDRNSVNKNCQHGAVTVYSFVVHKACN
jgi:hypothetical protein